MSDESISQHSEENDFIIDNEGPARKWVRFDNDFHKFVLKITESNWFNAFIMITIILNAFSMAFETDYNLKTKYVNVFQALDEFYLGIYTLEFGMKIYAEPIRYFYSSYNLFDLFVLLTSYFQVVLLNVGEQSSNLGVLRTLRALRTLRTLRTVSFVKGLQVLVTALVDTIRNSVLSVVLLLLLLMYLFAIIGYYTFGIKDPERWGNLGSAMLTLFSLVTVEGWTDIQDELDKRNITGSRYYTIIFIFIGHFIFTNVFIGLVIMNIHEATEAYRREEEIERELTIQQKKEYMIQRQHNEVKQMLEKQDRGHYKDFYDMVKEFQSTLRHDDYVISSDLATNLTWIETYITSLDHLDNTSYRLQQLHFETCNLLTMIMEKKLRERFGL